jgi:GtrA-like protein
MVDLKDYARKGIKFMVIGAVGSVVNLGVLYLLVEYAKLWYIWAEIIAIVIAFLVNFNGNILVKNIHIAKDSPKVIATSEIMNAEKQQEEIPPSRSGKSAG